MICQRDENERQIIITQPQYVFKEEKIHRNGLNSLVSESVLGVAISWVNCGVHKEIQILRFRRYHDCRISSRNGTGLQREKNLRYYEVIKVPKEGY